MTQEDLRNPVVVGVDGTDESGHAVSWALEEAARHGLPVRLVHAFEYPPPLLPFYDAATGLGEDHLREVARGAMARELSCAVGRARTLPVTGEVADGPPVDALLAEGRRASLLVVGTRGFGAFGELLVGSTGTALAAQAVCPVVVVPAPRPENVPGGPVVVGVDGSACSQAAVALAFGEASLRGAPLTAVHAWRESLRGLAEGAADRERGAQGEEAEHGMLLSEALAGSRGRYPDVEVDGGAVRGHPVRALLEASRGASLLVVGARGAGGYEGMPLGSVAQGVLHHANCPVCVVPPA
ncbi:universal stress protein [Streptomyces sp. NPDC001380]|uniref:universal stress protein n=1 Tax=Streptomyces sp. NPDC001380 TaxID=3364566 RepID=UPI003690EB45